MGKLEAIDAPRGGGSTGAVARCLALALDEIDYGLLLLDDGGCVVHANHAARHELAGADPLQLIGHELHARTAGDGAQLSEALAGARRGLRRLVTLGATARRLSVAVIPLVSASGDGEQATLVVLGRQQLCGHLAVQCYARSHGLTPAESRVLEALCDGLDPRAVAELHGVGLATVRTQIGHIRAKTGAASIRDLVRQVSVLPPMVSTLRLAA
jgi:DNA-binding CsgD family transcriptional regulator